MLLQIRDLALLLVDFFRVVDLISNEFEFLIGFAFQCPVKTRLITGVALAGVDSYFENQAVLVAIDKYLLYFLPVAAFFAFFPQFLA